MIVLLTGRGSVSAKTTFPPNSVTCRNVPTLQALSSVARLVSSASTRRLRSLQSRFWWYVRTCTRGIYTCPCCFVHVSMYVCNSRENVRVCMLCCMCTIDFCACLYICICVVVQVKTFSGQAIDHIRCMSISPNEEHAVCYLDGARTPRRLARDHLRQRRLPRRAGRLPRRFVHVQASCSAEEEFLRLPKRTARFSWSPGSICCRGRFSPSNQT